MSLEFLIWAIVAMYAIAGTLDWVLSSSAAERVRHRALSLRERLLAFDTGSATQTANRQFLYLFEVVYQPRFWSWKRLVRSCMSSTLAVVVFSVAMGVIFSSEMGLTPSTFSEELAITPAYWIIVAFGNLLADYLSLQETAWIMRRSQGSRSILWLSMWTLLDLILTSLIYLVIVILSLFIIANIFFLLGAEPRGGHTDAFPVLQMAFFLSTYVTSALWMSFFVAAVSFRALRASSPLLRTALQTVGESPRPARTIAGFVQISGVMVYGVVVAILWILEQ